MSTKRKFLVPSDGDTTLNGRFEISYEKGFKYGWHNAIATIDEKEELLTCVLNYPITSLALVKPDESVYLDLEHDEVPTKKQRYETIEVEAKAMASKSLSLKFQKPINVMDVNAPELIIPGLFKIAVDAYRCFCGLGSVVQETQKYRNKPNQDDNNEDDYKDNWYGKDNWKMKYPDLNPDNFLHWMVTISKEIKSGCISDVVMPIVKQLFDLSNRDNIVDKANIISKDDDQKDNVQPQDFNLLQLILTTLYYVIHGENVNQKGCVISTLLLVISRHYLGVGICLDTPKCELLLESYIRNLK